MFALLALLVDWTVLQANIPHGAVESTTLAERRVWVYTPPGYADSKEKYDLLVLFDGESYINYIPGPTIIDNLIAARRIRPIVLVTIDNSQNRLGDLANHQQFADLVRRRSCRRCERGGGSRTDRRTSSSEAGAPEG